MLTAVIGSTLGSVTSIQLICTTSLQNNSNGHILAAETAVIINGIAAWSPTLSNLHIRVYVQAGRKSHLQALSLCRLHVGHFVTPLCQGLVSQLTHLDINVSLSSSTDTVRHLILGLNSEDAQSLSGCTSLTHLRLATFSSSDLDWSAMPVSLQSLELLTILSGPAPSTTLPSLRHVKLRCECPASHLMRLVHSSPVLQDLHVRAIIASVCSEGLNSLRELQEMITAAALHALTTDCPSLVLLDSVACPQWNNSRYTGWDYPHSTSMTSCHLTVRSSRICLIVPETGSMDLSNFLEQMQPVSSILICSVMGSPSVAPLQAPGLPSFPLQLARVFPNLASLSIKRSTLCKADILELAQCTSLRAVHLTGCIGLTRAGVVQLARTALCLLVLEVHGCPRVGWISKWKIARTLKQRLCTTEMVKERDALLCLQDSMQCRAFHQRRHRAQALRSVRLLCKEAFKHWQQHRLLVCLADLCFPVHAGGPEAHKVPLVGIVRALGALLLLKLQQA